MKDEIEILCPECKGMLVAPKTENRIKVRCPYCDHVFYIPYYAARKERVWQVVLDKLRSKAMPVAIGVCLTGAIAGGLIYMMPRNEKKEVVSETVAVKEENKITNKGDYIKDKVAIIECSDGGSGTGFCLRMADGVYFVSNEHVFRPVLDEKPKICTVSGRLIDVADRVEIAKEFDLIRWRVEESSPCFELSETMPSIGNSVFIYGNSDGLGVVTEIKGTVQGVSHKRIETDAKFVVGNSGSPLINEDGQVVGVAALLFNRDSNVDWAKKGTRFDAVRRFAERIPNQSVAWKAMSFCDFSEEAQKYADYNYFLKCFCSYLYREDKSAEKNAEAEFVYLESSKLEYKMLGERFHPLMKEYADTYTRFVELQSQKNEREECREAYLQGLAEKDKANKIRAYDFVTEEVEADLGLTLIDIHETKRKLLEEAREVAGYKWINPRIREIMERDKKILDREIRKVDCDYANCSSEKEVVDGHIAELKKKVIYDNLDTLILYKYAMRGNQKAQSFFVESYHANRLAAGIYASYYWSATIPWFKKAFENGDKKAGLPLGHDAYHREKNVQMARVYWRALDTSEGFYLCGKSYMEEGNDAMALELYDAALKDRFRGSEYYEYAKSSRAWIYLYSKTEHLRSKENALRDLRDLLSLNSENKIYHYLYGITLWEMESSRVVRRDALAHIKKAKTLGSVEAEKFLDDNKEEINRL